MHKVILYLFLSLIMLSTVGVAQEDKIIVAKVNDQNITKQQFMEKLLHWFSKQALQELIDHVVAQQEIKRLNVKVDEKEVEERVKEVLAEWRKAKPSEKAYQEWLKTKSMNLLKDQVRLQLCAEKIVAPKLTVSEADILEYYKIRNEYWKVREIFLYDEKEAKKVLDEAKNPKANFVELVKKYSKDEPRKARGGLIEGIGYDLTYEFDMAIYSLKPGEISGIVKSEDGYSIIKVEEKQLIGIPYKDKREVERQVYKAKLMAAVYRWFDELKERAKIEILISEF